MQDNFIIKTNEDLNKLKVALLDNPFLVGTKYYRELLMSSIDKQEYFNKWMDLFDGDISMDIDYITSNHIFETDSGAQELVGSQFIDKNKKLQEDPGKIYNILQDSSFLTKLKKLFKNQEIPFQQKQKLSEQILNLLETCVESDYFKRKFGVASNEYKLFSKRREKDSETGDERLIGKIADGLKFIFDVLSVIIIGNKSTRKILNLLFNAEHLNYYAEDVLFYIQNEHLKNKAVANINIFNNIINGLEEEDFIQAANKANFGQNQISKFAESFSEDYMSSAGAKIKSLDEIGLTTSSQFDSLRQKLFKKISDPNIQKSFAYLSDDDNDIIYKNKVVSDQDVELAIPDTTRMVRNRTLKDYLKLVREYKNKKGPKENLESFLNRFKETMALEIRLEGKFPRDLYNNFIEQLKILLPDNNDFITQVAELN